MMPRQCTLADGKPKVRFETRAEAKREGRKWGQRWYRCRHCTYFHLSSTDYRPKYKKETPAMPDVRITFVEVGDPSPWPLTPADGRLYHLRNVPWHVAVLAEGMASGLPSLALRLDLAPGAVIAETSVAAWAAVTAALRGRYPESFAGGPLAVPEANAYECPECGIVQRVEPEEFVEGVDHCWNCNSNAISFVQLVAAERPT